MGMSPASSEIQKCIREIFSSCKNAINIKDNMFIFRKGDHNQHSKEVLTTSKIKDSHFVAKNVSLANKRSNGNILQQGQNVP